MLRGSRSGFPISGVKESSRPFLSEEFFPMIDKPLFFFVLELERSWTNAKIKKRTVVLQMFHVPILFSKYSIITLHTCTMF